MAGITLKLIPTITDHRLLGEIPAIGIEPDPKGGYLHLCLDRSGHAQVETHHVSLADALRAMARSLDAYALEGSGIEYELE